MGMGCWRGEGVYHTTRDQHIANLPQCHQLQQHSIKVYCARSKRIRWDECQQNSDRKQRNGFGYSTIVQPRSTSKVMPQPGTPSFSTGECIQGDQLWLSIVRYVGYSASGMAVTRATSRRCCLDVICLYRDHSMRIRGLQGSPVLSDSCNRYGASYSPRSKSPGSTCALFEGWIVNLGMLAPVLRRDVLVGCDGSSLAFGRNLENAGHDNSNADSGKACVSLPVLGVDPPSTVRCPNLCANYRLTRYECCRMRARSDLDGGEQNSMVLAVGDTATVYMHAK